MGQRHGTNTGNELPRADPYAIDIDPMLVALPRDCIGDSRLMRLFDTRNGSPLDDVNVRNRCCIGYWRSSGYRRPRCMRSDLLHWGWQ